MSNRPVLSAACAAVALFLPPAADAQTVCNPVLDSAGAPVASSGADFVEHAGSHPCPPAAPEPEPVPVAVPSEPVAVIASDVAFAFDSAEIRPSFYPELDLIAETLLADPDTVVEVVGHTDSVGTETYNDGLSMRRAQSVAAYLARQGVDRDRLQTAGRGEHQPVASNQTAAGRAENRRVEITTSAI